MFGNLVLMLIQVPNVSGLKETNNGKIEKSIIFSFLKFILSVNFLLNTQNSNRLLWNINTFNRI